MKLSHLAGAATLLAAGLAQAQDIRVNALVETWYTQMLDNNLRLNTAVKPAGAATYYDGLGSGRFTENGFTIRRTELYLNGSVSDTLSVYVMFDPNNSTATVSNNVLSDAVVNWAPAKGFLIRMGQMKMPTTWEGTIAGSRDIMFYDRSQLNRLLGDTRDRGAIFSYAYGDAKGFQGKLNLAVSNGVTDDGSKGKTAVDANAQKDYTVRFDGSYGSDHRFGIYYREGETNLKSSTQVTATIPATWTVGAPTAQQIKDNQDRTTLQGLFYVYDTPTWHADAEFATGLLGRRFPMLFAAASAPQRESLDQKYQGYTVSGAYKMGAHWFLLRYDMLNYNSGNDWYTATNPYKTATADYTPKYTEAIVGYNYLFVPTKSTFGKLKVDYIHRSKNFLAPRAGQVGEQGGDSIMTSLMVAF